VINECLASLHIFLFFNLFKYDVRQARPFGESSCEANIAWIFTKNFLRKLVDNRKTITDSDNEFKTRFDFLIYDAFCSYNSLFELDATLFIDECDLENLVESIAFSYFYTHNSNKFDDKFVESLLGFCINIFNKLTFNYSAIANKLAILCTREHVFSARTVDINTKNFEILKAKGAKEFIEIGMQN